MLAPVDATVDAPEVGSVAVALFTLVVEGESRPVSPVEDVEMEEEDDDDRLSVSSTGSYVAASVEGVEACVPVTTVSANSTQIRVEARPFISVRAVVSATWSWTRHELSQVQVWLPRSVEMVVRICLDG